MTGRVSHLRLLWAALRRLPDGEEALRAAVERINDRDATNGDAKGTDRYRSTKLLSNQQLLELAHHFRRRAKLPAPTFQARGPRGGRPRRPPAAEPGRVTFIASQGERDYVEYLFDQLNWSDEAQAAFIARQTKGAGMTSHAALNAVIAPLERMLRARGWSMVERDRAKTWRPPEGACCKRAEVFPCVCKTALRCVDHGEKHIGTHD